MTEKKKTEQVNYHIPSEVEGTDSLSSSFQSCW